MPKTVFYSWQSDLENRTNRSFIEDSIEKAIKKLNQDGDIEPCPDRDTKGVAGSPDIAETIFEKIRDCDAFVCDVSFVNEYRRDEDDPLPNPNVLIELGYAVAELGWDRIICVFNQAFGRVEDLPFDLRKRRITTYAAAPDDEQAKRKEERAILVSKLSVGVSAALSMAQPRAEVSELFDEELASPPIDGDPIAELPHWEFVLRPDTYSPERFSDRQKCWEFVKEFGCRSDEFVFIPRNTKNKMIGTSWVGGCVESKQLWRIFQSGQIISALAIDQEHPELRRRAESVCRQANVDPEKVRGFIDIDVNVLAPLTRFFQFAGKFCERVGCERVLHMQLSLVNVQGFTLTGSPQDHPFLDFHQAQEQSLSRKWEWTGNELKEEFSTDENTAPASPPSLRAIKWFLESFGMEQFYEQAMRSRQLRILGQ